jgi:Cdc6-like AAA superfamily ATPase
MEASKTEHELERELVQRMKKWQSVEDASLRMTKEIRARSKNPFVQLVMEIIAHDSAMHKRVQQFIIDSVEKEEVSFEPEDLNEIWDLVEKHAEEEKEAIALAGEAQKNSDDLFIPRYLFAYLREDERKHDLLIDRLLQ